MNTEYSLKLKVNLKKSTCRIGQFMPIVYFTRLEPNNGLRKSAVDDAVAVIADSIESVEPP